MVNFDYFMFIFAKGRSEKRERLIDYISDRQAPLEVGLFMLLLLLLLLFFFLDFIEIK